MVNLPSWLPGTRFLKIGAEGRELRVAYAGRPFERVKYEMVSLVALPHLYTTNISSILLLRSVHLSTKTTPHKARRHCPPELRI